jgi:hypothetical protein
MLVGGNRIRTEDDLPNGANPGHLDAHRTTSRRRQMETNLFPRAH